MIVGGWKNRLVKWDHGPMFPWNLEIFRVKSPKIIENHRLVFGQHPPKNIYNITLKRKAFPTQLRDCWNFPWQKMAPQKMPSLRHTWNKSAITSLAHESTPLKHHTNIDLPISVYHSRAQLEAACYYNDETPNSSTESLRLRLQEKPWWSNVTESSGIWGIWALVCGNWWQS